MSLDKINDKIITALEDKVKLLEEQVGICGHTIRTFSTMIGLPSQRVSNWVRDGMSETLFFICMNRLGVKVNMTGIN